MNLRDCPTRDESWVDYIRGTIPDRQRERMREHLNLCAECRRVHNEWRALLEDRPGEQPVHPPEKLKRWLKLSIVWFGALRRLRSPGAPVLAAALAIVLFVGVWVVPKGHYDEVVPAGAPFSDDAVLQSLAMVRDAGTVQLQVMPIRETGVRGVAWINDRSAEMILLVEGLRFESGTDYQVWSESAGRRTTIGLMHWTNGKAHMYYRGGGLAGADNIAVSAEPKGGSERPTGPDVMMVRLKPSS